MDGMAPPGMERVVKRLKRHKGVDNPWALAWWIHQQKGRSDLTDDEVDACLAEYAKFCGLDASVMQAGPDMMTPADCLKSYVRWLIEGDSKASQSALDYVEAPGGTRCATCRHAIHTGTGNEDEAECALMHGKISLAHGCCVAWQADPGQLMAVPDVVDSKAGGSI